MTREEIYSTIYTHEEIYRPPQEVGCACLEVALGCSWGKCLFCDFAKDKFQIHPMAKIEWNLRMLGRLEPDKTRLFLLGENAFVMSCDLDDPHLHAQHQRIFDVCPHRRRVA